MSRPGYFKNIWRIVLLVVLAAAFIGIAANWFVPPPPGPAPQGAGRTGEIVPR